MGNKSFRETMVSWKLYASPEDAEVGELKLSFSQHAFL